MRLMQKDDCNVLSAGQSRASSECLTASCIDTPNLRSLLHSCVLVGWFVTSRTALWIMKSVKPPLTFTPRDTYKPPSSLPCLRVSPPLGTCCFKDGQQSEELPAVMKFRVRSLERHLSASWGHTHTPAAWTHVGGFSLFLTVLSGSFTTFVETLANMFYVDICVVMSISTVAKPFLDVFKMVYNVSQTKHENTPNFPVLFQPSHQNQCQYFHFVITLMLMLLLFLK